MMKPKPIAIGLFVILIAFSVGSAVAALNDEDTGKLANAGLSDKTVKALTDLHQDADRLRPPEMTMDKTLKMAQDGFPDGLIRLMADLDRHTGKRPSMPISPDLLMELAERGTSMDSIWLLATSELARATGPVAEGDSTFVPPLKPEQPQTPETAQTAPPLPESSPEQPQSEGPELGRFPTKDAEGRRIIVYKSGNTKGLNMEVTRDAEGRREYRYSSMSRPPVVLDQNQENAVLKALSQFGLLNIRICR